MSVSIVGDSDFSNIGPPEWLRDGWDLDKVVVTYQGSKSTLSSFISIFSMWDSYFYDTNMFISDIANDRDLLWPTIRITYTGKKGGTLPPDRNSTSWGVQQARYTSFSGKTYVAIDYISPTSSVRTWSRSEIDIGAISPRTAADAQVVWWVAQTTEGASLPLTNEAALAFFYQKTATIGTQQEIVPGQYFSADVTKQQLLFSAAA